MVDDSTSAASGESALDENKPLEVARRSHRLAARIVDWFALGVMLTVIERAVWGSSLEDEPFTFRFFMWTAPFAAIAAVYEIALVATRGHTFGKFILGISIAQVDSSLRPGWKRSFRRWALPNLLLLIPYAGVFLTLLCYLSPLWNRERRGWHDRFAATSVLKTGPAPPYQSNGDNLTQDSLTRPA